MKRVVWEERQVGDIALVQGHNWVSELIITSQLSIHSDWKDCFRPSHAIIFGPEPGWVIESMLNLHQDSVAAVSAEDEYVHTPMRIWRIGRSPEQIFRATTAHLNEYAGMPYGTPDLFGFAFEALERALGDSKARNLIAWGLVCSMAALSFLRYESAEPWATAADLTQCDPFTLELLCQTNELTK